MSASSGSVFNGLVIAGGTNVHLTGHFSRLQVGRIDFCTSGDAATLDTLNAGELRVFCKATIGTAVIDTLNAAGGSDLSIAPGAGLIVNRGASITGSKLSVAGTLFVETEAVIAPSIVAVDAGGQVRVVGHATLGRAGASVNFASGSFLQVDGNATFDGGGTLAANVVTVLGNALFTSTGN